MKLLLSFLIVCGCTTTFAAKKINYLPDSVQGIEDLIQISGESVGYDKSIQRRMDGYIDFALVMPSLTKQTILNFDLNSVISPKSDTLKILNQKFEVPSNLSLPKQKESYILSIRINKPLFKTFVPKSGLYPVTAIHGKFKVKTVIDKIRSGKPIFDLLNDFKFIGGGQVKVNTNQKTDSQDVNINNFSFKGKATIEAPTYDEDDLTLFSVPLEATNGVYHPTDLKYIKSGETLTVATNKNNNARFALNILTDKIQQYNDPDFNGGTDEDGNLLPQEHLYEAQFNRITLSFLPLEKKLIPTFLNFVDKPQITHGGERLSFTPPAQATGTAPLATIIELVEAEKFKNGKLISEYRKSLWRSVRPGWVKSSSLPNIELKRKKGVVFRYEVSFVATSDLDVKSSTKNIDLDKFSLLTKNYLVIE